VSIQYTSNSVRYAGSSARNITSSIGLLAIAVALILPGPAAGQAGQGYTRERLLEVAHQIIDGARFNTLVTLDADGLPRIRPMDPLPPEGEMTIWFATNPNTRKVEEIRRDPRVSVYYFDPQTLGYVTISGVAHLVDDPAEKARRWKDDWQAFYPNRPDGYLLIEFTANWLEVVSVSHSVTGPDDTWLPPRVEFRGGS